ncbi:MAG TPA: hypothetical protein VFU02_02300 [Polyangiaceae bacterium]|nr:hypothetical protein [Polyangiaceae bacterium]
MTMTRNGVPIACDLGVFSQQELKAHVSLALDVLFQRPKRMQELPEGFLFEYEGNEALFMELARFAYNEHRCCPWESFALEMEPFLPGSQGTLRLRFIAGPEGKPLLAEALQHFREAASNPAARQQLLAALRGSQALDAQNKDACYDQLVVPPSAEASGEFGTKPNDGCGCR